MARILIIDDNADMLTMLRMFFERRTDHEVTLCLSGKDGLTEAFDAPPDIAVVDVMMPGMDGYEVVKRLRKDNRTKKIGIIILTARGQPVDKEAALKAGADAHLAKPVDTEALTDMINKLLAPKEPVRKCMVLPVLSLKGGVGVTTIATNMAALLQQVAPTILWDLSPNSGHAALFLGQQPKTHWGFLLQDSPKSIMPLLQQHKSGLRVLCAPPIPPITEHFSDQQLTTTLEALMENATFVVVDMPSCLDQTTQVILTKAHRIMLVTGDDPPSIQTTLASLQALRSWQEWMMLLHNTTHPDRHTDEATLQRMLRTPLQASLPYDTNQSLALRRGLPLGLAKPDSPFIVALKSLIQKVLRT